MANHTLTNNMRIRRALFETGVHIYELAHALGVSEMTIYRKLRNELPEEEQERLAHMIHEISATDRA